MKVFWSKTNKGVLLWSPFNSYLWSILVFLNFIKLYHKQGTIGKLAFTPNFPAQSRFEKVLSTDPIQLVVKDRCKPRRHIGEITTILHSHLVSYVSTISQVCAVCITIIVYPSFCAIISSCLWVLSLIFSMWTSFEFVWNIVRQFVYIWNKYMQTNILKFSYH